MHITLEEVRRNMEAYALGVQALGMLPCADGIYDPDSPVAPEGAVEDRILNIMEVYCD